MSVRTEVAGLSNKSSLIASLGPIYEKLETPSPKALESIAETATPQAFFEEANPNPFNPSTQIRFVIKEAGLPTLRVYCLNGQLVRELLIEYREPGEHSIPRNDRGITAASGVYFIRFEAGNEVNISKVMLVRRVNPIGLVRVVCIRICRYEDSVIRTAASDGPENPDTFIKIL